MRRAACIAQMLILSRRPGLPKKAEQIKSRAAVSAGDDADLRLM
jgi:hypothetical protein